MKYYKIQQEGNSHPVIVNETVMKSLTARTEKFKVIEEVDENGMNPTEAAALKAVLAEDPKRVVKP